MTTAILLLLLFPFGYPIVMGILWLCCGREIRYRYGFKFSNYLRRKRVGR